MRNNQQCGGPLTGQEENEVITHHHDELEGHLSTLQAKCEELLGQSDDYALTCLFTPLLSKEN